MRIVFQMLFIPLPAIDSSFHWTWKSVGWNRWEVGVLRCYFFAIFTWYLPRAIMGFSIQLVLLFRDHQDKNISSFLSRFRFYTKDRKLDLSVCNIFVVIGYILGMVSWHSVVSIFWNYSPNEVVGVASLSYISLQRHWMKKNPSSKGKKIVQWTFYVFYLLCFYFYCA